MSDAWIAERVWNTSPDHVRRVVSIDWPVPTEALLMIDAVFGATRVTVRPLTRAWKRSVAFAWLRGLDRRLRVPATPPRSRKRA
ncbi:MAG: hypothetical protein QM817_19970 [Archangium sp.]